MKQYPSGFVPANFKNLGKWFLILGVICIMLKVSDYFIDSFNLSNLILYFGIGCLVVGVYLIFIVNEDR